MIAGTQKVTLVSSQILPSNIQSKETTDESGFPALKQYFQDVIGKFKDDQRVYLWDIYNEPGNFLVGNNSLTLLQDAFEWAREVNPSQPISAPIWNIDGIQAQNLSYASKAQLQTSESQRLQGNFKKFFEIQMTQSDVITFHVYSDVNGTQNFIDVVESYSDGRPMICTEYMARTLESKFETILPLFKQENIFAINWGLVSGRTNTIFPWWSVPYAPEPAIWFHDIYRKGGTPFNQTEISIIKSYKLDWEEGAFKLLFSF